MASYAVLKRSVDEAVLNQNGSFHPMVVTENVTGTATTSDVTIGTITIPADSGYVYRVFAHNLTSSANTVTWSIKEGSTVFASSSDGGTSPAAAIDSMIEATGTARTILLSADTNTSTSTVTAQITVLRYFSQSEVDSGITIA